MVFPSHKISLSLAILSMIIGFFHNPEQSINEGKNIKNRKRLNHLVYGYYCELRCDARQTKNKG